MKRGRDGRHEDALGRVVASDEVVDRVRVTKTFFDLSVVHQVPFLFTNIALALGLTCTSSSRLDAKSKQPKTRASAREQLNVP